MAVPFVSQGTNTPFYGHTLYGGIVYGRYFLAQPVQLVGWPEFYQALIVYLSNANIVGPGQVYYAIDPDSVTNWPVGPSPFLAVEPGPKHTGDTDIGGGRFVKTWNVKVTIHIVANSSYDIAWQDTGVVTSPNLTFGPYAIEQLVTDKLEQAYIKTQSGNYATVEFPRHMDTRELRRFKASNQYVSLPLEFEMTVENQLGGTLFKTGLLPDSEDY